MAPHRPDRIARWLAGHGGTSPSGNTTTGCEQSCSGPSREGKGSFRRFRDLIHDEDLADTWYAFSNDRQLGRARAFLADEGIHASSSRHTR